VSKIITISNQVERDAFVSQAPSLLADIQNNLLAEAKARIASNPNGWTRVVWCKPTGPLLAAITDELKKHQLSIRIAPLDQPTEIGVCVFTGKPGVEEIIIGKSY